MCRTSSVSKHTAPCGQVEKGCRAGINYYYYFFDSSVDLVFTISELENWASSLRLCSIPFPLSFLPPLLPFLCLSTGDRNLGPMGALLLNSAPLQFLPFQLQPYDVMSWQFICVLRFFCPREIGWTAVVWLSNSDIPVLRQCFTNSFSVVPD